jgi:hypothetical protein
LRGYNAALCLPDLMKGLGPGGRGRFPRRTYFREPVLAAFRLAASTALKAAVRRSFSSVALRLVLPRECGALAGRPDVLTQDEIQLSTLAVIGPRPLLLLWRSSAGADGAPIVEKQHR